ncbi:mucin-binding protein, partial [Secundilactobacillus folii]|uniref:mucin-binding protein n=1 Tax=Secundilactobacillus folii TaxID=2678357 RepID=UPI0015663D42
TDTVTGTTDQDQSYTVKVPAGYEVVDSADYADGTKLTINLKADDSDNVTIHLTHGTTTITPDTPTTDT